MRRAPCLTLALAGFACLVHASPALTAALEFNRAALNEGGQLWRLVTAHFTHFGVNHLAWDVAALLILGSMAERDDRRRVASTLTTAAIAIGVGVWAWQPQFGSYRGLSGLDSALFGLVCGKLIADGRRARHGFSIALGALALTGFALKCGAELAGGATIFAAGATDDYAPVPLAHLIGLAVGLAGSLNPRRADGARSRPRASGWPCPWRPSSPGP
jgi:rhomboid family GlyGly-CTERM serine protease